MLLQLPSSSRVRSLVPTTPEGASSGAELVTSDGRALALASATLRGEAQGGLARLVLEQRFENPHDEILRVTYRMPLPADGAVSGYEFVIGERVVKGVIDRKRAARERFERAIVEGKTAALLEQERADIFTQQIGNIPPREAVVARITIDQRLVWLPEGEWELRFPTVIGPRYIGTSETAADARAVAVATKVDGVAARIQIDIAIRDAIVAGRNPSSPSHALEARADKGALVVGLRDAAQLDRDIVLRWPVAGASVGLGLAHCRPLHGDDMFGLLTIVPPSRESKTKAIARDLIVLVDTSGSMSGGPLDKAKQVIALLIESLGDADRLELIEFSSSPRRYKADPVMATRDEKQRALAWVRKLQAGGGTEMRSAVIEAMRALRPGSQRQVVLATDGYIGGEQQIVQQLNSDLPKSCRLHFVGVGSSVNRTLSTSLARAGRGAEVLCDLDEDAERACKRLIDRTRQPQLTNVTLAGSAIVATAPEFRPDVFEGAPLVAAVKLRAGEIVVRGDSATGPWEQRVVVHAKRAGEGNQAFAALYGREHVADLESRAFAGESNDAEIERTGLVFQISTRLTSWIAVDESRAVTGPSRHEVMPQALPYGTTAAAFGLRGAAVTEAGESELSEEMALGAAFDDFDMALEQRSSIVDKLVARKDSAPRAASAGKPASKTVMLGARSSDAPAPQQREAPAPERSRQVVVPEPAKRASASKARLAAVLALLALIAALIWWLLR